MVTELPADRWLIITDNLSTHHSRQKRLGFTAWPEICTQFVPKYASWLNLIEPWWKQLRSLALKGRRFENRDDLSEALIGAVHYWNAHRHPYIWKKRTREQFYLLGGCDVNYC